MNSEYDNPNPYDNLLDDEGIANKTVLFVGELEYSTTDAQIEEQVQNYGATDYEVRFFTDVLNGKSIGHCKVRFQDTDHAKACMEGMNGHVFNGKPCTVSFEAPESLRRKIEDLKREWYLYNSSLNPSFPGRNTDEGLRRPLVPPTHQMIRNAGFPSMRPHMNPSFLGSGEARRLMGVMPPPYGDPTPRNWHFQEMNPMLPNARMVGMNPLVPWYPWYQPWYPNVGNASILGPRPGAMPGSWIDSRPQAVFGGSMQGNVQYEAMHPRHGRESYGEVDEDRRLSGRGADYDHRQSRLSHDYEMYGGEGSRCSRRSGDYDRECFKRRRYGEGRRRWRRSAEHDHGDSRRRQGDKTYGKSRRRSQSQRGAEHDQGYSRKGGHSHEKSREGGTHSRTSAEYDPGQSRRRHSDDESSTASHEGHTRKGSRRG
ncbi:hypothetical protein Scep_028981 [Stephania cephalantha]|uniref:RRM domain-containing protein n=1 Tax=Stephania cephalantha TaxID=152367 RepID=A0AAP0EB00_9MAGN